MMSNKPQACIVGWDRIDLFTFVTLLKKHKSVKVTGLGIFSIKPVKRKTVNHPITQKLYKVKNNTKVMFIASQQFKDKVL